MNTKMALIAIFVSAVITFGLRSLPFLVFQEGKELPDQIKRLGMVLPSSIMAVLIVYCLKDVGDDFMADGLRINMSGLQWAPAWSLLSPLF